MKFAQNFRETLKREDFPPHWVECAIPYGLLKKCLKKVQQELKDYGLEPETLRELLSPSAHSPLAVQYELEAKDPKFVRPRLTVLFYLEDGVATDAKLTSASRAILQKLAEQNKLMHPRLQEADSAARARNQNADLGDGLASPLSLPSPEEPLFLDSTLHAYEVIEVPLVFNGEFFEILQSDVNNLDALQAREQRAITKEIVELGQSISQLSKPSRLTKNDLTRWRRIFELYLDAQVFFSTHDRDFGDRSSQHALAQLQWFQREVSTRNLTGSFRLTQSRKAFSQFIELNAALLKNLHFQELNRTAVTKILKKFDKRTSLGVSKTFPVVVKSDKLLAGPIVRDVCAVMSTELLSVVPQLSDYMCPVCFSIAWRPIRLECGHIYCIRCTVKLQRRREKNCPLCRSEVVLKASPYHLDHKLMKFMKKYFEFETKEKQRANDIERGIELFGPQYQRQECLMM